jgi:hypothetical protein
LAIQDCGFFVGLTVAMPVGAGVQLSKVGIRTWVEPSLKVPVAVSCTAVPLAIEEVAGVTAIEVKTAAVTVRPVVPWIIDPFRTKLAP